MAQNLWNAGAVDNIFAPYDWSNGAPQPGDTLVIGDGTAFLGDSNIYGDTVVLAGEKTQPTLIVYGSADVSVQVAYNSAVPLIYTTPASGPSGTIDVVGAPTLSLQVIGGKTFGASATVNIADYSQMQGGFSETQQLATLTINGPSTSTFANNGSSEMGRGIPTSPDGDVANINVNVVGVGTFDMGYSDALKFTSGVSAGQTINDNGGELTIADTQDFKASVVWTPPSVYYSSTSTIELPSLTADHYSYANGVLSLTSDGSDVFDLHLQTNPSSDVVAAQGSGGISVYQSAAIAAEANVVLLAHA